MGSSSLTRDQTQAPCMGAWSLSHWTARKVHIFFIRLLMIMCFVSTFWLWWIMFLQLLLCSCKNFKSESCSVVSDSFWPRGLYSPWNSPGQNTGVSHSLLQGIFPTQGSNPVLPHCRWVLYQLSHQGSPRILEWVAYPFSSRSSQPRNYQHVVFKTTGLEWRRLECREHLFCI